MNNRPLRPGSGSSRIGIASTFSTQNRKLQSNDIMNSMFRLFQSFSGKWSFQRDIVHKLVNTSSSPFSNLSYFTPTSSSLSTSNYNSNSGSSSSSFESPPTIVTGSASFELKLDEENTYQYYEEGLMKNTDGTEFNVSQRYIYKYNNNEISVYFDEKPERLLHTLKFDNDSSGSGSSISSGSSGSNIAKGHHLCGCDTYDAIYQFISPREFKLIYSVVGPKKNYKITTTFSKLSL